MNDDAAERANRRKSAHFGDLPSAGSSSSGAMGKDAAAAAGRRVVSALAVQAQAGSSSGMTMAQKKAKRLSAVGVAPTGTMEQVLPGVEVNNEKFEEWMKLATDNVGPSAAKYKGMEILIGRKSQRQIPGTLRSSITLRT